MKIGIAIIIAACLFSASCSVAAGIEPDRPFTLKKNESRQIGPFKVTMLSVGHTFGEKGGSAYANLEINGKGQVLKRTLDVGETTPIGDKFLQLVAVDESADPKLSDPFAATSCTLSVVDQAAASRSTPAEPSPSRTPPATSSVRASRTTLTKVAGGKVRLGYGKRSAIIDLDETPDIILGGDSNHRIKLYFATVTDENVYYVFEVRSGPAMSDPNGPCGGDSPQTLVWLKTDLSLKVIEARSEVFASCAYNGGRYLQGKVDLTPGTLSLVFKQQMKNTRIFYDTERADKGFELSEMPSH